MDCRLTLHASETFLELLRAANQSGQKVYLLIDDTGISRTEGFVSEIHTNTSSPVIELDNGTTVELAKIVAVNGIFRPEYSEC